ncbi:hypothetical protein ACFWN2_03175 [Lentzea sp. NPDC058436]|uniref:effector-associated constant component EACC1 n=1 Tax=Lentzea sp. NPDC058436 TaxID=3346499 RepID=UPI0036528032
MDIAVRVMDGQADELRRIDTSLRTRLEAHDIQIDRVAEAPRPGDLGVLEVLQFLGENVLIPVVVQALYDHVSKRLRQPGGSDLKVVVTRTDLPGDARRTHLTVEGEARDVAAVLKELE